MGRESKDSPLSDPTVSPKKPRRRLVASLTALVVVSVIVGLAISGFSNPTSPSSTQETLTTWHRWGISIHYPGGLTTQYMGVDEAKATSNSGMVQWVWNKGGTSLTLVWVNATQDELQPGFPGVYDVLRAHMRNVMLIDRDNVTMGGATWEYQTYRSMIQGEMFYSTVALSYYPIHHRLYGLVFVDTNPESLASLRTYGETFRG